MTAAPDSYRLAEQLPGWTYQDPTLFDQEMAEIFARTWQYAGRVDQVDRPGSYLTVTVGREPLIVLRSADGELRAFHNVCPHRGMRLLDGTGSCGALIVCPYHAWSFNHCGDVHKIPKQEEWLPDANPAELGLFPASVDEWRGFVFVNADPAAQPLAEYLAEFPAYLDQHQEKYEELELITTVVFDEPVNWKLLVENYVEDYHFGFVHPRTLKVFDFEKVRTMPTGRHVRVLMPYREQQPDGPCKYPWDPSQPSYQGYIFPGTTVQTASNHVSLFRLQPISAVRTVIEIPVFQTPRQREAAPLDLDELRADIASDMEEDFVICRELQRNVAAKHYRIGALAQEHELGVAHFQRTWLEYMRAIAFRGSRASEYAAEAL